MDSKNSMKKLRSNDVNYYVPDDLILSILQRLPAKSLMRFKCVCKKWFSSISGNRKLLLIVPSSSSSSSSPCIIKFFNLEGEGEATFPRQQQQVEVEERSCSYMFDVIGSYGDTLCILFRKKYVVLWKPSSGRYALVPKPENSSFHGNKFGLGYDYSTKDYKIVRLYSQRRFQIYSLDTNSWGKEVILPWLIDFVPAASPKTTTFGISMNGALYWSIKLLNPSALFGCILGIDLTDRKFSLNIKLIHLPEGVGKYPGSKFELLDFGRGQLCMAHYQDANRAAGRHQPHIDMWVMENYSWDTRFGNWIKVMKIPVLPCNLEEEIFQNFYEYHMTPIFCFKNGTEILMHIRMISPDGKSANEFYLYNKEENTFKKFEIQGAQDQFCQCLTYTDSLIYSPFCHHLSSIRTFVDACNRFPLYRT